MSRPRPSVAFLMRHVHHYREGFYAGLDQELGRRGIDFDLIHGQPSPGEASKNDSLHPEWALLRKNRILQVGPVELIYQPVFRESSTYDLVLVEQASRLVVNYALQLQHLLHRGPAIGLVGHGANIAASPNIWGERFKSSTLRRSDWFFGYTEGTRERLISAGYPSDRITIFQNTLDTTSLRDQLDTVGTGDVAEFRQRMGLKHRHLVLTLGSLYPDKRPELVSLTSAEVTETRSDVDFLIVGSGPSEETIRAAASRDSHVHIAGPLFGRDKAVALAAADLLLVPGVAGLIVLDSFVAGLPIVTSSNEHHPPEVDYLVPGTNCSILPGGDPAAFAVEIRRLLDDPAERDRLGANAVESGRPLTVDNMVQLFADGVENALGSR